jgi:hypothetical protein
VVAWARARHYIESKKKRRTKAEMEAAREEEARVAAASAAAKAAEQESISQTAISYRLKLTNHWSDEEQRELHHAGEVLRAMKQDTRRHRDEWLTVIGPKVLLVCERIFKETGATSRYDHAYRKVVNETLAHYGLGLDQINRDTRSALVMLMEENIEELQKWLADKPRLTTPRTILDAWEDRDSGYKEPNDLDENVEYLGEEPDTREEVQCDKCGTKTKDILLRDGRPYCYECDNAAWEALCKAEAEAERKAEAEAKRKAAADGDGDDADDDEEDSAGDGDDARDDDKWIPGIDPRVLNTIGELKEYIEEAITYGAKSDNSFFVENKETGNFSESVLVHFCDDDGPDSPSFMVIDGDPDPDEWNMEQIREKAAKAVAHAPRDNKRILDLESKLTAATSEREHLYSENASLKLISKVCKSRSTLPLPTRPLLSPIPLPSLGSGSMMKA